MSAELAKIRRAMEKAEHTLETQLKEKAREEEREKERKEERKREPEECIGVMKGAVLENVVGMMTEKLENLGRNLGEQVRTVGESIGERVDNLEKVASTARCKETGRDENGAPVIESYAAIISASMPALKARQIHIDQDEDDFALRKGSEVEILEKANSAWNTRATQCSPSHKSAILLIRTQALQWRHRPGNVRSAGNLMAQSSNAQTNIHRRASNWGEGARKSVRHDSGVRATGIRHNKRERRLCGRERQRARERRRREHPLG